MDPPGHTRSLPFPGGRQFQRSAVVNQSSTTPLIKKKNKKNTSCQSPPSPMYSTASSSNSSSGVFNRNSSTGSGGSHSGSIFRRLAVDETRSKSLPRRLSELHSHSPPEILSHDALADHNELDSLLEKVMRKNSVASSKTGRRSSSASRPLWKDREDQSIRLTDAKPRRMSKQRSFSKLFDSRYVAAAEKVTAQRPKSPSSRSPPKSPSSTRKSRTKSPARVRSQDRQLQKTDAPLSNFFPTEWDSFVLDHSSTCPLMNKVKYPQPSSASDTTKSVQDPDLQQLISRLVCVYQDNPTAIKSQLGHLLESPVSLSRSTSTPSRIRSDPVFTPRVHTEDMKHDDATTVSSITIPPLDTTADTKPTKLSSSSPRDTSVRKSRRHSLLDQPPPFASVAIRATPPRSSIPRLDPPRRGRRIRPPPIRSAPIRTGPIALSHPNKHPSPPVCTRNTSMDQGDGVEVEFLRNHNNNNESTTTASTTTYLVSPPSGVGRRYRPNTKSWLIEI